MVTNKHDGLTYILSISGASVAGFAMQLAGVVVSALLGAVVAWLFNTFVKPKLDQLIKRKTNEEA